MVYIRSPEGILYQRDLVTTWYFEDETPCSETKPGVKYYDAIQGYEKNKKSRNNLINKASMYLFQALIANDPVNGEQQARDFLVLAAGNSNIDVYKSGNIVPLVDFIDNTMEVYITDTVRATMKAILNVTYP